MTPLFSTPARRAVPILLAAGLTLGLAIPSFAQPDAMPGKDRTETRAQAQERATAMFRRMDANGDGRIDEADRAAREAERFARMDADGDGALTLREWTAAHEDRREARPDRRAAGDDGPRGGKRMGPRHGGHGPMGMMHRADTDGDGVITQAEFTAAALARFDAMDSDRDGTVTAAERRAARAAHRPDRPRRPDRTAPATQ